MKRLLVIAVIALLVGYPAWLAFRVWDQSHQDEIAGADAIIILGAAQYDGDPSPVFEARLDHAAFLYRENLADVIIVTGGKQTGDRFTEAGAGESYLIAQGIPEISILRESQGHTTFQSLRGVRDIAARHGIDSVLLVSDPLHSERIRRMATDLDFGQIYTSPAGYTRLNRSRTTKVKELFREVASILAYELLDR